MKKDLFQQKGPQSVSKHNKLYCRTEVDPIVLDTNLPYLRHSQVFSQILTLGGQMER